MTASTRSTHPKREPYLGLAKVAEILGVTVPTVRALIHAGDLDGFQVGARGIWRVDGVDLEAYVQRQKNLAQARRESRS